MRRPAASPCFSAKSIFFSPDQYQPGAEKPYVEMYKDPLEVESGDNSGFAVRQSLPSREEDRNPEDMPVATNAPKLEKKQTAQYPSPNIYLDPVNTGYGGGLAWYNDDIFHTGMGWDISTTYTTRSYYDFNTSFYKLKIVPFFDSTEIYARSSSSSHARHSGESATNTKTSHETIYWWTRQEAELRFKKHFFDHYGVDTIFFYRDTKISSGQQPIEGTQVGKPSFEDHFGVNPPKDKWGGPLWGVRGGHTNGFSVTAYRDMRDDPDVPHRGDYESLQVYRVGPELFRRL